MSVRRAQAEIDSAEFTDWIAFYRLEPWGAQVEDMRTGATVSMLANLQRDAKKRPHPFGLLEFVPWSDERRVAANDEPILMDDPAEQTALMKALMRRKSDG